VTPLHVKQPRGKKDAWLAGRKKRNKSVETPETNKRKEQEKKIPDRSCREHDAYDKKPGAEKKMEDFKYHKNPQCLSGP